ncbi:phenylalanine 4-monooxygenase [Occallatibacter riparius]|uniref:Phenylalanine 4-monooxygenase n=1 Tax=Occallatibacter riparius TaxID=1002689 RepID=A0A9J7BP04_9BACT|nr:phenylalanine 4-monooxygenase [Occallatibacter riparius]UWZ84467.1 phenylalanine 4-monooxygenase [Occallatibacter riparius]
MATATLTAAAPYLIQQVYAAYTPEQHAVWAELVGRVLPNVERHAAREYLEGFQIIGLQPDRLPNLADITKRLGPRTGWSSTPVSGFLPAPAFFEMLANRLFPTTTWLRSRESLEYTPEPDIFHDVFGHVPMHAHRVFGDFLEHYGRVCAAVQDQMILEKLGRLFWYTVEFGLIRQDGEIKAYGSGVISSAGECQNVINGGCAIHDFSLDEVLNTPVKVDELQKVLFAVNSFDQIYEAMHEAEQRVERGSL